MKENLMIRQWGRKKERGVVGNDTLIFSFLGCYYYLQDCFLCFLLDNCRAFHIMQSYKSGVKEKDGTTWSPILFFSFLLSFFLSLFDVERLLLIAGYCLLALSCLMITVIPLLSHRLWQRPEWWSFSPFVLCVGGECLFVYSCPIKQLATSLFSACM